MDPSNTEASGEDAGNVNNDSSSTISLIQFDSRTSLIDISSAPTNGGIRSEPEMVQLPASAPTPAMNAAPSNVSTNASTSNIPLPLTPTKVPGSVPRYDLFDPPVEGHPEFRDERPEFMLPVERPTNLTLKGRVLQKLRGRDGTEFNDQYGEYVGDEWFEEGHDGEWYIPFRKEDFPSEFEQVSVHGTRSTDISPVLSPFHYLEEPHANISRGKMDNSIGLAHGKSLTRKKSTHMRGKSVRRRGPAPPTKLMTNWTKTKFYLLFINIFMFLFGVAGIVLYIMTFLSMYTHADIITMAYLPQVILFTVCTTLAFINSLVGFIGIYFSNRRFLSLWALLMWVIFGTCAAIGYVSYRYARWTLIEKLYNRWSHDFTNADRLLVQNEFNCCGFNNPFVLPALSAQCYALTDLPGCRNQFYNFSSFFLQTSWTASFICLVPIGLWLWSSLVFSNRINNHFNYIKAPKIKLWQGPPESKR